MSGPCPHPAESIVATVTDWNTLHERCEECGALVLSTKLTDEEAATVRHELAPWIVCHTCGKKAKPPYIGRHGDRWLCGGCGTAESWAKIREDTAARRAAEVDDVAPGKAWRDAPGKGERRG